MSARNYHYFASVTKVTVITVSIETVMVMVTGGGGGENWEGWRTTGVGEVGREGWWRRTVINLRQWGPQWRLVVHSSDDRSHQTKADCVTACCIACLHQLPIQVLPSQQPFKSATLSLQDCKVRLSQLERLKVSLS